MGTIRLSARAKEDLLDIWCDIAPDGVQAADRVYDRLEERVAILSRFPKAGLARPDIAAEARALSEPPYLILYREIPDGVQIVRVMHGARRITAAAFAAGIE